MCLGGFITQTSVTEMNKSLCERKQEKVARSEKKTESLYIKKIKIPLVLHE